MNSGSTMTLEELPTANATHPLPAALIPTTVRCHHCFSLAHQDVEERLKGGEIAVRYVCPDCRAYSIRHYHDGER